MTYPAAIDAGTVKALSNAQRVCAGIVVLRCVAERVRGPERIRSGNRATRSAPHAQPGALGDAVLKGRYLLQRTPAGVGQVVQAGLTGLRWRQAAGEAGNSNLVGIRTLACVPPNGQLASTDHVLRRERERREGAFSNVR